MPARDRAYRPGLLLLVLACVTLAKVVTGAGEAASTAAIFAIVIAIGFQFRPDVVGAGMGALGIVVLALDRLGASNCRLPPTAGQNASWLVSAAIVLLAAVGLRLVFSPVRSARRLLRGGRSIWGSGGDRRPGTVGSGALAAFGVLELADLVLRPESTTAIEGSWTAPPVVIVLVTVAAVVLSFGLAALPEFTTSVVGVGVGLANLILLPVADPCHDLTVVVVTAVAFIAVSWATRVFR